MSAASASQSTASATTRSPRLPKLVFGSARPAVRGNVESDAVGIVEFHLVEAAALGGLAHPVPPAGRLDALARPGHVVDDEAEVVHADELAAAATGELFLAVVQEGEVDHAV